MHDIRHKDIIDNYHPLESPRQPVYQGVDGLAEMSGGGEGGNELRWKFVGCAWIGWRGGERRDWELVEMDVGDG